VLRKIISGGQTGVDQAALQAAADCGYATGGWLPLGCMTLDGPNAALLTKFNMREHAHYGGYRERTRANVRDSDATLRIASNLNSLGERCTLRAITDHAKPHLDVKVERDFSYDVSTLTAATWITANRIAVLNVAGNSERTSPGIYKLAYDYMTEVLERVRRL
jgi:hypothetical protein